MRRSQTEPGMVFGLAIKGLSRKALAGFVVKASRAAALEGAVNVMVTDNHRIRALNAKFRGKDEATDVLSFPTEPGTGVAGDIALSLDIASASARSLGHTQSEEVRILVLHGILHLAGYDHERDDGEMAREEMRLRRHFGLPTGLIERSRRPSDLLI